MGTATNYRVYRGVHRFRLINDDNPSSFVRTTRSYGVRILAVVVAELVAVNTLSLLAKQPTRREFSNLEREVLTADSRMPL